jgi:hypothetical protein
MKKVSTWIIAILVICILVLCNENYKLEDAYVEERAKFEITYQLLVDVTQEYDDLFINVNKRPILTLD